MKTIDGSNHSKVLVIAIYSHPGYYPPTLSAVELLSSFYSKIYIVHRNITGLEWKFPANVELVPPGPLYPVREVEQRSTFNKIGWFWQFTRKFYSVVRSVKPDAVLLYDALPVLSYRLIRSLIRKPQVLWYHNHDVSEVQYLRKYSLGWWAWKSETSVFPQLDLFSLPSLERQSSFKMNNLGGKFFFLPNYPLLKVFNTVERKEKSNKYIDILYHGSISPLHGLEEIIAVLGSQTATMPFRLIIVGFIDQAYLDTLKQLAKEHQVEDRFVYHPPIGYKQVIENAFSCHIGVGIYRKKDMMNSTLGTASNKIYEYAGAGLPVLVYDNAHFREKLAHRPWIFFTDTSADSLLGCLARIMGDYQQLSMLAQKDFETGLCFESHFNPILEYLENKASVTS